ncbi:MAG: hypothetical protein HFF04_03295 [Oscillospiraceae bacterium]|nr:hypothetical protein [Oscillospiraceae bacterium]
MKNSKRILSLTMAGAMLLGSLPAASAAALAPSYDEAYYATLDYYGALTDASVVKSYRTNGSSVITDRGGYDEIINLTNTLEPQLDGDTVTFDLGEDIPEKFYFEGKTTRPFEELPWTVSVSYKHNGAPALAEELGGKSGLFEIDLDVYPNPKASEYLRHNLVLTAATAFNDDEIVSLEAPGAEVQLIGNLRAVLFAVLPGEEQHFAIRVGSEDFSFPGLVLLAVPATLQQIEKVSELREAKEEVEDAYHTLDNSLDVILSSLDGMSGSLAEAANGLDRLNQARGTISQGKGEVYDSLDAALAAAGPMTDSMAPMGDHLATLQGTLTQVKTQLDSMSANLTDLRPTIEENETILKSMKTNLSQLQKLLSGVGDDLDSIQWVTEDLGEDLGKLARSVDQLGNCLGSLKGLQDQLNQLETAANGDLAININGTQMTVTQLQNTVAQADQLHDAYEAKLAAGGVPASTTFQAYLTAALMTPAGGGLSAEAAQAQAAEINTLYTAYQGALAGGSIPAETTFQAFAAGYFQGEGMPAEAAQAQAAQLAALRGMYESDTAKDGIPEGTTFEAFAAAYFQTAQGGSLSAEQAQAQAAQLVALWTYAQTDEYKKQMESIQSLQALLDQNNMTLEELKKLVNTVDTQTKPLITGLSALCSALGSNGVSGDLQQLCNVLEEAIDDGDRYYNSLPRLATNLGSAAALALKLNGNLDTALAQVGELTAIMDQNDPELQQSLTDARTFLDSASESISALVNSASSAEKLLKNSGPSLDAGTRQALTGLADVLRRSTTGLGETGNIRSAKTDVSDLIEEEWNSHTGESDNLLLIDAGAKPQSMTSSRNSTPNSVQYVMRTQEIKAEQEPSSGSEASTVQEKTTFWGRIKAMFRDLWNAITSIF